MRRGLPLLLALALVLGSAAVILWGYRLLTVPPEAGEERLLSPPDTVTMAEEVTLGTPEAAEDLRVALGIHDFDCHLSWHITFSPGRGDEADTEFNFYPEFTELEEEDEGPAFAPSFGKTDYVNTWGGISDQEILQELALAQVMYLPIEDLAGRTAAGEERTEWVDLADYYTCWPVYVETDMPLSPESEAQITEFFRFPIPAKSMARITVSRDAQGFLNRIESESERHFPAISAAWEETWSYLFFDRMGGSVSLDTGEIPGGYGVYRMDYAAEPSAGQEDGVTIGRISLVLPVAGTVKALNRSADGSELLVLSQEEGILWLSVLDWASGDLLQRLPAAELERRDLTGVNVLDDALVLWLQGDTGILLERGETGWRRAMENELAAAAIDGALDPEGERGLRYLLSCAYDGQKLALLYEIAASGDEDLPPLGLLVVDKSAEPVFAAYYWPDLRTEMSLLWDNKWYSGGPFVELLLPAVSFAEGK